MRVLLVSTFERMGGAAVAASRLGAALRADGVEVQMLVRDKQTNRPWVVALDKTHKHKLHFLWERFCIWASNRFSRENLFSVSLANTGMDITRLPAFKQADLIHLHWINQGMLSLDNVTEIIRSGKPVVWTMHDMWNATGICHHARECDHYFTQACRNCFFIDHLGITGEPSAKVFRQKKSMYAQSRISFVACSVWLRKKAELSPLMAGLQVMNIPNPIDTGLFSPLSRSAVRAKWRLPSDRKLLLFGSMKVTDKRKGIDYMIEACRVFSRKYPEQQDRLGILMMGNRSDEVAELLPFPVYSIGFISREEEIVEVYNVADLYVTPSLEENLPNTIMEALSCGVPCVGYETGGIPEMIDHRKNGYVAQYKSAEDLADGIHWTLFEADSDALSQCARNKVLNEYSEHVIAKKYIDLYQSKMK